MMRTTAKSPETDCIQCGTRFKPKRGSLGKFCCMSCSYQYQRGEKLNGRSSYFNCCKCHAALGFGIVKSSQFVRKEKGNISKALNIAGINRYQPEGGSWQVSAAILRRKEKAWQDAWMSEYKAKFPEWNRSDFPALFSPYQRMSEEERKQHNRKNEQRIRSCPIRLERKKKQIKEYAERNRESLNRKKLEYMRSEKGVALIRKYRKYPINKIKHNLRKRMRDFLKKAKAETMSVSGLIGCNSLEFKHHIEKQFRRGMTWDNYGTHWHVDHILPCASFDHTNKKQVAQCWHYTNLRPLRASENMLKSDTITEPQMSLLI